MARRDKPPARPPGSPRTTAQRLAIGFLVLAGVDVLMGQKMLATVFAGLAIAISLGAGFLARKARRSGSGR